MILGKDGQRFYLTEAGPASDAPWWTRETGERSSGLPKAFADACPGLAGRCAKRGGGGGGDVS